LNRSIFSIFLDNFALSINKNLLEIFPLSWTITKTFFVFLRNWIRHYESMRQLLYTSLSQQLKIIETINVADILFWYIIRKGKKLTARIVFFKFLKKFKKNYALPGLAIFVHAMLMVEPHIWLKKKKIAGRLYEIPIYISAHRSKCIAIRWLLQAAKKRKWASITDSLSQEVWDACFKKGGAFLNKELVQLTAKRNKAYLRWL
jgi:small subunit ribosomal protein S7